MPSVNQRISEYVLDEKIGGGTFGEVWRAHHHVWTDQQVAIKIPTDPQYIRNLQREGTAIHGLVHPNIVRALGFDPYGDPPYLVMEYVPGRDLRKLIQSKALTVQDAVAIIRQVLAGLEHAHEHGLIHRDIKPENILIHQRADTAGYVEGTVKVTDFGLGQVVKVSTDSIAYSASMNSADAERISGTLDYMPREQREGAEVDARADLYACGVVLYEMLTGERPTGNDLPSDINKLVPKHLDEVFRRSYTRLDKRFASTAEFAKALVVAPPPLNKPPVVPPVLPPTSTYHTVNKSCPSCRQAVADTDQFCMHCGLQLVSHVRRCPQCGAYPDVTDRFCIFCGQTLAAPTLA
jgi:serine/threonine protein kinase